MTSPRGKNPIRLGDYWYRHYESAETFNDFEHYGQTIRRAMDAGQPSAIILRLKRTQYVVDSPAITSPRGSLYHNEEKRPKMSPKLHPLIRWLEMDNGLQWKLGVDANDSGIFYPIVHDLVDFIVYWEPCSDRGAFLLQYWLKHNNGDCYSIAKRAIDCGQKYAILRTLYNGKDYVFHGDGYKDKKLRSSVDMEPMTGVFSLCDESLIRWAEHQRVKWFIIMDSSDEHNWAYFTVYWDSDFL